MKNIFFAIFLTLLFFPLISSAGILPDALPLVRCGWGEGSLYPSPCQLCDLFGMFDRIINFLLFYIVPPLAALMIAIGGFMYIFAHSGIGGGGSEGLSRANSLFKAVIIGLVITYGAWLLVKAFFLAIGVMPIFQNWNIMPGCPGV